MPLPGNTRYTTRSPTWSGTTDDVNAAITREKQLKKWERAWKTRLIEERSPGWEDLYPLIGYMPPPALGFPVPTPGGFGLSMKRVFYGRPLDSRLLRKAVGVSKMTILYPN